MLAEDSSLWRFFTLLRDWRRRPTKGNFCPIGKPSLQNSQSCSLAQGQISNLSELTQNHPGQERNDAKHVRILIPCVAAYLGQALAGVTLESLPNVVSSTSWRRAWTLSAVIMANGLPTFRSAAYHSHSIKSLAN